MIPEETGNVARTDELHFVPTPVPFPVDFPKLPATICESLEKHPQLQLDEH